MNQAPASTFHPSPLETLVDRVAGMRTITLLGMVFSLQAVYWTLETTLPKNVAYWLPAVVVATTVLVLLPFFGSSRMVPILVVTLVVLSLFAYQSRIRVGGIPFSVTMPVAVLLIGLFVLRAVRRPNLWLPAILAAVAYLTASILSLSRSLFPWETLAGMVYLVFFFTLFYAVTNILRTRNQVMLAYVALMLVAVAVTLMVWGHFALTGEVLTPLGRSLTFGNRLAATTYLVPTVPLLFAFGLARRSAVLLALAFLSVGACLLLGSRMGIVAIALGSWVVLPRLKYLVPAGAAILAFLLLMPDVGVTYVEGFVAIFSESRLLENLRSDFGETVSASRSVINRWAVMIGGISMFLDSPLVGWGLNTSFHMTGLYNFPASVPVAVDISEYYLHSTHLTALAETGILGLVALVAFQAAILARVLAYTRRLPPGPDRVLARGVLGGVVGVFTYYLTLNGMNTTSDYLYLGFALAAVRALHDWPPMEGQPAEDPSPADDTSPAGGRRGLA